MNALKEIEQYLRNSLIAGEIHYDKCNIKLNPNHTHYV